MDGFQLELNIDCESPTEAKLTMMQKQLDAMNDSMGKVRRKLFGEMGEVKKLYAALLLENAELKKLLEKKDEKIEWVYAQGDRLFDVREVKEAIG